MLADGLAITSTMTTSVFEIMDNSFLESSGFNLPSPLSTSPSGHSENPCSTWSLNDRQDDNVLRRKATGSTKRRSSLEQEKLLACTSCRQKKIKVLNCRSATAGSFTNHFCSANVKMIHANDAGS